MGHRPVFGRNLTPSDLKRMAATVAVRSSSSGWSASGWTESFAAAARMSASAETGYSFGLAATDRYTF